MEGLRRDVFQRQDAGRDEDAAPLELLIQDEQIIPVNVGDHDAVY
jgi:hypothetical protein